MAPRVLIGAGVAALAVAGAAAASPGDSSSWAAPEIRAVAAAGLMDGQDVASFRGADPLTAQELENLVFALKARLAPEPVAGPVPVETDPLGADAPVATPVATAPPPAPAPKQAAIPDRPVTIGQLDARLVGALGLSRAAAELAAGARAAGLAVPARFGSEAVARLLGLRLNHPARDDSLELRPRDAATRAEAAYSVAQLLRFDGSEAERVQALADTFELPALSDWQRRILDTAVARIGMPYVWGGTSDRTQTSFGVTSRGGYDCSGFVWRVYKLEPYDGAASLASVLRGRTTFEMSGEVPRSARIGLAGLRPADVVFFGDRGPRSRPAQVGHMGIYLGGGWFIHSSSAGVALARLDGWYARSFAWARRPLAEAGVDDGAPIEG